MSSAIPDSTHDATTRAAILEHFDAFNSHSAERLLAGLHDDVVWATGVDVFRGTSEVRELFDEGLWRLNPFLQPSMVLVDGEAAAVTAHEYIGDQDGRRDFAIAVFFTLRNGLIHSVKVFREGTADVES